MAARGDVHVEWHRSPRVIVVEAPSTSITVEDLVDTLRDIEDEIDAMDDASLLDATGKQELDAIRKVGITVVLNNAQVAFEQRSIPLSENTLTGQGIQIDVPGIVITDSAGAFDAQGTQPGDIIVNYDDRIVTTVIDVISDTQLRVYPPVGGLVNEFRNGDRIKVYSTADCTIDGGNVVAVDANGDSISPLSTTAMTSVSRESSTSAAIVDFSGIVPVIVEQNWDKVVPEGEEIPGSTADLLRQAANNETIIIF